MITFFTFSALYLASENNETELEIMTPEAWIALAAVVLTFGGALIGIWVKTRSEIEVIKNEVATLREMVKTQIDVDVKIASSLTKLEIGQARLEERIKSL